MKYCFHIVIQASGAKVPSKNKTSAKKDRRELYRKLVKCKVLLGSESDGLVGFSAVRVLIYIDMVGSG